MRSGETCISIWIGSDPNLRFSPVGAAEGSRGRAALANRRASIPIDIGAQFFGVRRHFKPSTRVYVNPRVNVFAPRHFFASNAQDGR
jgi:hypothetical protein